MMIIINEDGIIPKHVVEICFLELLTDKSTVVPFQLERLLVY